MKKRKSPGTSKGSVKARMLAFVESFLRTDNGTQAAIDAGFSPRCAKQQGSRMLSRADVQAAIEARRKEMMEKDRLTTDTLHTSLRQALMFDPRRLFRPDGTLIPIHELPDDIALALNGLEVSEEVTTGAGKEAPIQVKTRTAKVKLQDKNSARDQLARMLGAYEKDNRQRTDPLSDLLREVMGKRTTVPIAGQDPAHR